MAAAQHRPIVPCEACEWVGWGDCFAPLTTIQQPGQRSGTCSQGRLGVCEPLASGALRAVTLNAVPISACSAHHDYRPLTTTKQGFKTAIEQIWWNRIRTPETIRSLLQLVYARPSAVDDELLERIVAATQRPDALDAFTSILLSPRTELTFNEMLEQLQCPVCMAYGGFVYWGGVAVWCVVCGTVLLFALPAAPLTCFSYTPCDNGLPQQRSGGLPTGALLTVLLHILLIWLVLASFCTSSHTFCNLPVPRTTNKQTNTHRSR